MSLHKLFTQPVLNQLMKKIIDCSYEMIFQKSPKSSEFALFLTNSGQKSLTIFHLVLTTISSKPYFAHATPLQERRLKLPIILDSDDKFHVII